MDDPVPANSLPGAAATAAHSGVPPSTSRTSWPAASAAATARSSAAHVYTPRDRSIAFHEVDVSQSRTVPACSGVPTIGWLPKRVAVTGTPDSGMSALSGALGRYGFRMRTLADFTCGTRPRPVTVTRNHTRPGVVPASMVKALRPPARATPQVLRGANVVPSRDAARVAERRTGLAVAGIATVIGNEL